MTDQSNNSTKALKAKQIKSLHKPSFRVGLLNGCPDKKSEICLENARCGDWF